MAETQNRSIDLPDMLVNTQRGTAEAAPTSPPYYLGAIETTATAIGEQGGGYPYTYPFYYAGLSITAWGPPYYCTTAIVPTAGQIVCGFWSCN